MAEGSVLIGEFETPDFIYGLYGSIAYVHDSLLLAFSWKVSSSISVLYWSMVLLTFMVLIGSCSGLEVLFVCASTVYKCWVSNVLTVFVWIWLWKYYYIFVTTVVHCFVSWRMNLWVMQKISTYCKFWYCNCCEKSSSGWKKYYSNATKIKHTAECLKPLSGWL